VEEHAPATVVAVWATGAAVVGVAAWAAVVVVAAGAAAVVEVALGVVTVVVVALGGFFLDAAGVELHDATISAATARPSTGTLPRTSGRCRGPPARRGGPVTTG
jgi:hypothetical protein